MISGGGTGGHIYPAISIAQSLKAILNEVEILFVGAQGKMEMKKVPEAGFKIVGLWISGIQRNLSVQNLLFPLKLIKSILDAFKLIKDFKPDAVVGVGGYASGPLLFAATLKRIPTLIQEQNSYAGLTNKWLSGRVNKICVAYDGMEKYFPANKIVLTGNPVRENLKLSDDKKAIAFNHFGLSADRPVLLILGGSLGARTINECMLAGLSTYRESGIQVLWQTGGYYYVEMKDRAKDIVNESIIIVDFIREMNYAYGIADVVISRAGALSIAELMITEKPVILVPSPNVAEDHQTKNAMSLVAKNAALMVKDSEASHKITVETIALINNKAKQLELSKNIAAMAHPLASKAIANEVIKLVA